MLNDFDAHLMGYKTFSWDGHINPRVRRDLERVVTGRLMGEVYYRKFKRNVKFRSKRWMKS